MYYISQETINEAYISLSNNTSSGIQANGLFQLLILKFSGITDTREIDTSKEEIKASFVEASKYLGYLYKSEDYIDNEYNFINPFNMEEWGSNTKESVIKWSTTRLVNNVVGGGRYWRNIIQTSSFDSDNIKLYPTYLDYISLNQKFSLEAISIWLFRFFEFEEETSLYELISIFLRMFKINQSEKHKFFTSEDVSLSFSNEPVDSLYIRKLISARGKEPVWQNVTNDIEIIKDDMGGKILETYEKINSSKYSLNSIEKYKELIDKVHQIIIKGPPGSSKSYLANKISRTFYPDTTIKIQFHPQYTYQQFIGGDRFSNQELKYNKGVLLNLIDEAIKNDSKEYLLIIDEINRSNIGQVFGEAIQLLDRGEVVEIETSKSEEGKPYFEKYYIPNNLKIIGTMNTSDRSLSKIDFALKRRFYEIYCGVDYHLLSSLVKLEESDFTVSNFVEVINTKLMRTLRDTESVIGHALFMKDFVKNEYEQFQWSKSDFKDLFYFSIVPMIEDYCSNELDIIQSIIGQKLYEYEEDSDVFMTNISEWLTSNDI